MPQIGMPPRKQLSDGSPTSDLSLSGRPVKEGNVHAVNTVNGRRIRVPVVLKVYASSLGHYAVFGQDKVICRDCGYINLKHCTVQSSCDRVNSSPSKTSTSEQFTFQLVPRHTEGQSLTFVVSSKADLDRWLSVLGSTGSSSCPESRISRSKVIPGSARSPTLGELSPLRVGSPRLGKETFMPSLEEE